MKRIIFAFLSATLFYSCTNKKTAEKENVIVEYVENLEVSSDKISENFDWLTEYGWALSDGRYLVDPTIDRSTTDWIGLKTPLAFFEKIYLPIDYVVYQVRPSWDFLYFVYQTEEKEKLYPIGSAYSKEVFDFKFEDEYSSLTLRIEGVPYGTRRRNGQQIDSNYPLVGIWGKLPALIEYKLVNMADCMFYMDIEKEIPGYAIRRGTYLFKQTGENTFETISSFPDGHMKLEIEDERRLILTPLFTLPDEEGILAPLIVSRSRLKSELLNSALAEDEY